MSSLRRSLHRRPGQRGGARKRLRSCHTLHDLRRKMGRPRSACCAARHLFGRLGR